MLDGSSVSLSAAVPGFGRSDVTSFAVFRVAGRSHEFVSGPRAFAATDAESMGIQLSETYSLMVGGVIRVGSMARLDESSGAHERLIYGAWEGDAHSVRTVLFQASAADVIALFDRFSIEEDATGVALNPKDPREVALDRSGPGVSPCVVHRIHGFGLLEVGARTQELNSLARGLGRVVPGGELFVDGGSPDDATLLHLSATAKTRVYPERDVGEAIVIEGAASIRADWRPTG